MLATWIRETFIPRALEIVYSIITLTVTVVLVLGIFLLISLTRGCAAVAFAPSAP